MFAPRSPTAPRGDWYGREGALRPGRGPVPHRQGHAVRRARRHDGEGPHASGGRTLQGLRAVHVGPRQVRVRGSELAPDPEREGGARGLIAPAQRSGRPVPALGVGVAYQPALVDFLTARAGAYDYLEVVPDT